MLFKQSVDISAKLIRIVFLFIFFNNIGIGADVDTEGFTNFKIARIESLLKKGTPSDISFKDKDVLLVLGNTGAGKSTVVNYLLGYELDRKIGKITSKNPSVVLPAKIGNRAKSETLFPSIYDIQPVDGSRFPYLFCDCPGFWDTRGEDEKICSSILIEMIIRNARSLRAMVVVDYGSLDVSKGDDIKRLSKTLKKLIPDTSVPLLFAFNKVPHDVKIADIDVAVKDLIECRKEELEVEIRRCLNELDSPQWNQINEDGIPAWEAWRLEQGNIPEEVIRDRNVQERMDDLRSLNFLENNKFIRLDVLDRSSRNDVRACLQQLSPISREHFCFDGYNDDRVRFNKILIKECGLSLRILQAKTALAKYKSILENAVDQASSNSRWYHEQIERLSRGEELGEMGEKLSHINNKILELKSVIKNRRPDLHKLRTDKDNLDVETPEFYWRDRWNDGPGYRQAAPFAIGLGLGLAVGIPVSIFCWPIAVAGAAVAAADVGIALAIGGGVGIGSALLSGAGSGVGLSYFTGVEHESKYRGIPFVYYVQKDFGADTQAKVGPFSHEQRGEFDATYVASGWFRQCSGTVEIFVPKNSTPDALESIQQVDSEIGSLESLILDAETKKEELTAELSSILTPKMSNLEKEYRINQTKEKKLRKVLETIEQIDRLYRERTERINLWYKVSSMLESTSVIVKSFRDFHKQFREIRQIELPNTLVDPITLGPLLDAVQTSCCGQVFNRLSIETHLNDKRGACPCCSTAIDRHVLTRVPVVERLFDELTSGAVSAAHSIVIDRLGSAIDDAHS